MIDVNIIELLIRAYVYGGIINISARVAGLVSASSAFHRAHFKEIKRHSVGQAEHHVKQMLFTPIWPVMWVRDIFVAVKWYINRT